MPFALSGEEDIDYGYTVPLLLLTEHLTQWSLIPIATASGLDAKQHFECGKQMKRVLQSESKRIAVIASADLSHHATHASPEGARSEGEQFDATLRTCVSTHDVETLLSMDAQLLERAGQCGHKPIALLYGLLDEVNIKTQELAYESPFGVGYLTARIDVA
jgi:AmmeMemoRadiSam system protein B